jgi:hypothetical protein
MQSAVEVALTSIDRWQVRNGRVPCPVQRVFNPPIPDLRGKEATVEAEQRMLYKQRDTAG